MRKILISTIILLLFIAIVFAVLGKISIAEWSLPGVVQIKSESIELDKKINEIVALTEITFNEKTSELTAASKRLSMAKEDYENKIAFSSEEDIQNSRKFITYETEVLWTTLGNHATRQGVLLDYKVQSGTIGATKSLSFTVTGQYIPITDFIAAIENDDRLEFVIESFSMVTGTNNNLIANFMVKDIYINVNNSGTTQDTTPLTTQDEGEKNNNTNAMNKVVDAVNGANNTMSNSISQ